MRVSDRVRVSGLMQQVDAARSVEDLKEVVREVLRGIDSMQQDFIRQLGNQPHIFTVDPSANPVDVEGAREGDVAIFETAEGAVDVYRFKEG